MNIGQSGLNYGVSYMQQYLAANDSTNGLAVGSTVGSSGTPMYSGAVDGGTMSWYATKTGSATWTIYANAVSPNGAVTRRLSLNMGGNVTTQTTTLTASPVYAYGYVMADPNADCASLSPPANGGDSIANSAALTVPIFIASSLCISAGAPAIGEPAVEPAGVTQSVTLYVGKTFRTSGTANPVGSAAKPILSANIVGGCQVNFHGLQNRVCSTQGSAVSSSGSGVYASSYPVQQQSLVKPTIDTATYSTAMPGPANDCNGSSVKNLFKLDNNGTRNTSLGTINLFHLKNTNQADTGNNFDCRYYDGTGNLVGQLTWVDGNPGTLTVKGTIFLDGNLNLSANDKVEIHRPRRDLRRRDCHGGKRRSVLRRSARQWRLPHHVGHLHQQRRARRDQPPKRRQRGQLRRRRTGARNRVRERQLLQHKRRQHLRQRDRRLGPAQRRRQVRITTPTARRCARRPLRSDEHRDDLERPQRRLVAVLAAVIR